MKNFLYIAIIIAAGYFFTNSDKPKHTPIPIKLKPAPVEQVFECDGRQHCSQMISYEEAVFFNNNCPDTKMDGDYDGKPCERQFNRH